MKSGIVKRGNKFGATAYSPEQKRKVWVGTFDTEAEAVAARADAQRSFRRVDPATVDGFNATWLERFPRPSETTNDHNRYMISAFLKEFGDRRLDTITRGDARGFAIRHPAAAKIASALMSDAFDCGHVIGNPFAGLRLARAQTARSQKPALTEAEVMQLADACVPALGKRYGEMFRAMVIFHAYTGLRSGELQALNWDRLDLEAESALIDRSARSNGTLVATKTKVARTIVLFPPAIDALDRVPRRKPWVFSNSQGNRMLRNTHLHGWAKVKHQAGMPDAVPYDLRHAHASWLADRGASARDLAQQLGNSVAVCERVYVHLRADLSRDRLRMTSIGSAADIGVEEAVG